MNEQNPPNDLLDFTNDGKPQLPGNINVLTILTFIGSGIALLFSFANPWILNFSKKMMDQAAASGKDFTTKQLQDMENGRKAVELAQANIVPLVIVGIVAAILCIVGAVWMRKLKKDGFWIYAAGEILPLVAGFILIGTAQFSGVFATIVAIGLPLLFIILYATQRKYLTK